MHKICSITVRFRKVKVLQNQEFFLSTFGLQNKLVLWIFYYLGAIPKRKATQKMPFSVHDEKPLLDGAFEKLKKMVGVDTAKVKL